MTDASTPGFGPMHPVTRLDRVLQQLRSFQRLQADELTQLATRVEAGELEDVAAHLTAYREIHSQEQDLVIDEIADIRAELAQENQVSASAPASPTADEVIEDPAAHSPKRARWLAEQERQRNQPVSRRDLFTNRRD